MLKNELGDEVFWNGLRAYYEKYKFSNASTNNFKNVMAKVSGKNLDSFFKQWLEKTGQPVLKSNWLYFNGKTRIIIEQTQEKTFHFPLDLEIVYKDGSKEIQTIQVSLNSEPFELLTKEEPKQINFDPNTKLLFEEN